MNSKLEEKMKKTYLILLVVLIVALSGCSSNETTGLEIEELESETTVVESEISEEEIGINVDRERVSGQISKIVGNSLTLELYVGTVIKSSANPDMAFEIENLTQGMNITVFINSELTDKEKATNPDSNIIYASTVNIIESN
jgi:hypothetical protein